jgi:hypothetical protein
MDAFDQQVGGYQGDFIAIVDHGRIVANAFDGGGLLIYESFGQVPDKPEFA